MPKYANFALLALAAIVVSGFAYAVYVRNNNQSPEFTNPGNTTEITLAQVALNNKSDSCWIIVGQKVYNLTPYLATHTEDSLYKQLCGTDATEQLGGEAPSKKSKELQNFLSAYYMGILVP